MTLAIVGISATGCVTHTPTPPLPVGQTPTGGLGWFDCTSDSECVLIRDPSCYPISINRGRVAEMTGRIAAALDEQGGLRECPPLSIDYVPVCLGRKCSSIRPQN